MIFVNPQHFSWNHFYYSLLWKSHIFYCYCWMFKSLCCTKMSNSQSTMKQYWPDLFFFKVSIFLVSHLDLIWKSMPNILKNQYYFIKCWAESIVNLCVCFLQIKNIVMFLSQFCWKFNKSLLECFFRSVCILLEKIIHLTFFLPQNFSNSELLYQTERRPFSKKASITIMLSHFNYITVFNLNE